MSLPNADAAPSHEAPLSGRLFFTDEERRALDDLRRQFRGERSPPEDGSATAPAEPPTESLAIDGVVLRANGGNTVWINGEPVSEGAGPQGKARIVKRPDNTVEVEVSRGRNNIHLKPGERIVIPGAVQGEE